MMNAIYSVIDPISILFFSSGLILGFLMVLIALFVIIKKGKIESVRLMTKSEKLSEEELKEISRKHKATLKTKNRNDSEAVFKNVESELYSILQEISSHYFPESETPMLEITIDEALDMIDQIADSIDYFIDREFTGKLGKMKISALYDTFQKKNDSMDEIPTDTQIEPMDPMEPSGWFKKVTNTIATKAKAIASGIKDLKDTVISKAKMSILEIISNKLMDIAVEEIDLAYSSKNLLNDRNKKKRLKRNKKNEVK